MFDDDRDQTAFETMVSIRKEHDLKIHSALKALANTEDGKYFLRWIMDECKAFQQEYPADDRFAMWNAGRRSFAMQLIEKCTAVGIAHILLTRQSTN